MRSNNLRDIVIVLIALSIAGCQSGGTPPPESADDVATEPAETEGDAVGMEAPEGDAEPAGEAVALDMSQSGQTVEVAVGQEITVTLDANATTGYSWTVDQIDEAVLAQQGEPEYQISNPDPELVGGGGRSTFHFRAAAAGQTELRLLYHQEWDQETPPAETFTATIVVGEVSE